MARLAFVQQVEVGVRERVISDGEAGFDCFDCGFRAFREVVSSAEKHGADSAACKKIG